MLLDERRAAGPGRAPAAAGQPCAPVGRRSPLAVAVALRRRSRSTSTGCNEPLQNGAAFWPAAGVTVAALLLVPTRHWWMVAGAVLLDETRHQPRATGWPLLPSLGWGLANAVEPLVGAALVRRWPSAREPAVPVRRLLLFLACAAGVGPAVGAAIGALVAVHATGRRVVGGLGPVDRR